MNNTYICEQCGKEYEKGWSDEEAEKELKEMFGSHYTPEDCAIVCEDCYKELMK